MLDQNGKKHVPNDVEDVFCRAHYKQFVPLNIYKAFLSGREFFSAFMASFREQSLCSSRGCGLFFTGPGCDGIVGTNARTNPAEKQGCGS